MWNILAEVKETETVGPVLIHIITEKGRGYEPAETASDKMHGVVKYDPITGKQKKSSGGVSPSAKCLDTPGDITSDLTPCSIPPAMYSFTLLKQITAPIGLSMVYTQLQPFSRHASAVYHLYNFGHQRLSTIRFNCHEDQSASNLKTSKTRHALGIKSIGSLGNPVYLRCSNGPFSHNACLLCRPLATQTSLRTLWWQRPRGTSESLVFMQPWAEAQA